MLSVDITLLISGIVGAVYSPSVGFGIMAVMTLVRLLVGG